MADLVRHKNTKNAPVPQEAEKLVHQSPTAPDLEFGESDVDISDEITNVAIAAADAPFAKAYSVYSKRFSNNLKDFQSYVRSSQQKVSQMLTKSIYEVHGIEDDESRADSAD